MEEEQTIRGKVCVEDGKIYYKYLNDEKKININSREFMDETYARNPREYDEFRNKYKEFVLNMNSREFAEMMLREGGEKTRINIMMSMHNNGIKIPKILYDVCKAHTLIPNYLQIYFDTHPNLDKLDMAKYYEFKEYLRVEYNIVRNFPPYIDFKNYYLDKMENEKKISTLTDLDCELMKFSHYN